MIAMESASWRTYRRYVIIARTTFFGFRRYDVWALGQLVATFRDAIDAELYIDSVLNRHSDASTQR